MSKLFSTGSQKSLANILIYSSNRLSAVGIETARLDARLVIAWVLRCDQSWIIGHDDYPLSDSEIGSIEAAISRREKHEPLAYILGRKEFWSLDFTVTPATLIPRPETEGLVESVLNFFPQRDSQIDVLDLGTGSGCILLAILTEYDHARGVGVDTDKKAIAVARGNAQKLRLEARTIFLKSDWYSELPEERYFDVVVANPPYLTAHDMATLPPTIGRFEPATALFGGKDGLDCYREIFKGIASKLKPNGILIMEIGSRQRKAIFSLALKYGLIDSKVTEDAAGLSRYFSVRI